SGLCELQDSEPSDLHLFFFTLPSPSEIYTLSLHDALPIFQPVATPTATPTPIPAPSPAPLYSKLRIFVASESTDQVWVLDGRPRSEEHTSELQSRFDLVCRLLLEKKKHYSGLGREPAIL